MNSHHCIRRHVYTLSSSTVLSLFPGISARVPSYAISAKSKSAKHFLYRDVNTFTRDLIIG